MGRIHTKYNKAAPLSAQGTTRKSTQRSAHDLITSSRKAPIPILRHGKSGESCEAPYHFEPSVASSPFDAATIYPSALPREPIHPP
jgi:hypothetical protein